MFKEGEAQLHNYLKRPSQIPRLHLVWVVSGASYKLMNSYHCQAPNCSLGAFSFQGQSLCKCTIICMFSTDGTNSLKKGEELHQEDSFIQCCGPNPIRARGKLPNILPFYKLWEILMVDCSFLMYFVLQDF